MITFTNTIDVDRQPVDVFEYLASLQEKFDRDRSWLINAIVRDYARRVSEGQNLELFDPSATLLPTRQMS